MSSLHVELCLISTASQFLWETGLPFIEIKAAQPTSLASEYTTREGKTGFLLMGLQFKLCKCPLQNLSSTRTSASKTSCGTQLVPQSIEEPAAPKDPSCVNLRFWPELRVCLRRRSLESALLSAERSFFYSSEASYSSTAAQTAGLLSAKRITLLRLFNRVLASSNSSVTWEKFPSWRLPEAAFQYSLTSSN